MQVKHPCNVHNRDIHLLPASFLNQLHPLPALAPPPPPTLSPEPRHSADLADAPALIPWWLELSTALWPFFMIIFLWPLVMIIVDEGVKIRVKI